MYILCIYIFNMHIYYPIYIYTQIHTHTYIHYQLLAYIYIYIYRLNEKNTALTHKFSASCLQKLQERSGWWRPCQRLPSCKQHHCSPVAIPYFPVPGEELYAVCPCWANTSSSPAPWNSSLIHYWTSASGSFCNIHCDVVCETIQWTFIGLC